MPAPPAPRPALIFPNGFEANFTVGYVRGLCDQGVPIIVASCADTHERLRALGVDCVNLLENMPARRGKVAKVLALLCYHARAIRLLAAHRGSVMHFIGVFRNTRVLYEGLLFSLCLRLFARRYLYTAHNTLPHGKNHSRLFAFIYRLIYRFPHRILVHTRKEYRQLTERFGVPESKLVLTSLGLNEEMPTSKISPSQARADLGFEPAHKVVLFFGKLEPYKGLDTLIAAFDRLDDPDTRLLIAGALTSPGYRREALALIDKSRRREHVILHEGHVPNEKVEVYFKGSDVLCLPYRNIYQSGLVFLSPRFGLPMVTSDVGSLREFVEPGMGIVADTNDGTGLARALERFFAESDRFRREAIIEKAQAFRWENVCKPLIELYR